MKKYIKLFSAVILVLLMVLGCCSCKELDQMKNSRAVFGESSDVVYFRDTEYKLLPMCEDLKIVSTINYGRITQKDVPVLVSEIVGGVGMTYDNDGQFVSSYRTWENSSANKIYCRIDLYGEMVAKINDYKTDKYCYSAQSFEYDENDSGHYDTKYIVYSQQIIDKINVILSSGNGREVSENDNKDLRYIKNIYACDTTGMFVRTVSTKLSLVKIYNEYYLYRFEGEKKVIYPMSIIEAEEIMECSPEYLNNDVYDDK